MAQQLEQSSEPLVEDTTAKSLSCSEMYQEFLQIEKHCEDSVESIIANFNANMSGANFDAQRFLQARRRSGE